MKLLAHLCLLAEDNVMSNSNRGQPKSLWMSMGKPGKSIPSDISTVPKDHGLIPGQVQTMRRYIIHAHPTSTIMTRYILPHMYVSQWL